MSRAIIKGGEATERAGIAWCSDIQNRRNPRRSAVRASEMVLASPCSAVVPMPVPPPASTDRVKGTEPEGADCMGALHLMESMCF